MPQAAAAAVVAFFELTGVAATLTTIAVQTAVAYAANQVINKAFESSSRSSGLSATRSLNATLRQSAAPRRLIYGKVKAGGLLVYPAQTIDGVNAYLDVYLGEGPIQSINPVFYIGEDKSDASKFSGLVSLEAYLGAPGQAASAALIAASGGEWTTQDVGTGCAHAVVHYIFERNAFPQGLILPVFEAEGRPLFDPRTNTTVYSANPALVLLDFLRLGLGYSIDTSWFDMPNFAAAANVCDEILDSLDAANVVNSVPNKVRRYELNGVFEIDGEPAKTVETILAAMGGNICMREGKIAVYAGAWRPPSGPTLTDQYLRAAPSYRTHAGRQQRVNIMRGTYREPKQDWQDIDYHEQRIPSAIAQEGEIVQPLNFQQVTKGAIAQRLALTAMRRARSAVPLALQCNWAALAWDIYDVVTVDLPQIGVSGDWLIVGYEFSEGGGINMSLVPHLASDYAWNHAIDEKVPPAVIRPDFNTTPPAVTGLVVTGGGVIDNGETIFYGLSAIWTATVDAQFKHYETQYAVAASGNWVGSVVTQSNWSQPLTIGTSYDFRVRVVRTDDTVGAWATETAIEVSGDTTPPDPPTNLSVTGTGTHTIAWKNPASLDVMRARVYIHTANDPVPATEIAEVFGLPSTNYNIVHTPAGVPRYYWVTAVDRSGNESARTFAGTGN